MATPSIHGGDSARSQDREIGVVDYEVALPLLASWGFDIDSKRFAAAIASVGGSVRFDDFARWALSYMLDVVEAGGEAPVRAS